ncbi:probable cytochrome P450 6a18 [Phlebotomus argentipes]|uniref:probable cytochrome P450 6a18 n=1 Tax=Phlebotomus argentipes TaxID=94469 RepID=UPI0028930D87|nr:probable cytochrome P450 6a18 [Phlebotomus argentipes]
MPHLDLVTHETMHINAPAQTLHKLCTKRYVTPQLLGQKEPFVVQPGTAVLKSHQLHPPRESVRVSTDPEIYADPELFNPLRFTEERQKRPKCSYLPFGESPRICIGIKFGILQTELARASVVKNFTTTESPHRNPLVMDQGL